MESIFEKQFRCTVILAHFPNIANKSFTSSKLGVLANGHQLNVWAFSLLISALRPIFDDQPGVGLGFKSHPIEWSNVLHTQDTASVKLSQDWAVCSQPV